jgi:hypothetical protein
MAALESLYTAQKVYGPLARALDVACDAEEANFDRFSVQDGGIESQVARHCSLYPGDPDVAADRALPASAFDTPAAGAPHAIRWLSLADIHHSLTDDRPVVAFVVIGRTVFFRVERQIERPDGEDENAYTTLVLAVTNHLRELPPSEGETTKRFEQLRGYADVGDQVDGEGDHLVREHLGRAIGEGGEPLSCGRLLAPVDHAPRLGVEQSDVGDRIGHRLAARGGDCPAPFGSGRPLLPCPLGPGIPQCCLPGVLGGTFPP